MAAIEAQNHNVKTGRCLLKPGVFALFVKKLGGHLSGSNFRRLSLCLILTRSI